MTAREIVIEPFSDECSFFLDCQMSWLDKLGLALFACLVTAILVITAWSGVLLLLGAEEGGGPLGAIARLCAIHLLV